ncbi:acyl-CoA-binding domain-containing protein 4-like isoform X1 [Prosopis cineraria]|uniref:acyl-CoA-binding domain-containing protein 4-like isoform X1 n=2 Tax=Prosopis cineraria TaxID=364024 RepID=UPI00240F374C|nr:acyl-CoA-binding domain-containing protein 4-like isoform X1 [Prosopis cineraria]
MGSLGSETAKKAMWLYPKVLGFKPSERWGHSACFSVGLVYVFGGCCGGLHFSDVLTLDLNNMTWRKLATTGEGPGPRDSHSAVLEGHKMIVFGGTNGFKKVNDIHILDLITLEWVRPECKGSPPSPRESHTATLFGEERLVIFGGSGEGDSNYLNDLHILDLRTMRWTSPEVKGDLPVPRDSHTTLAIGNKLFVYGGDSGDQYHGNVNMLDLDTMTWSKLTVQGPSPGVRAGHAAVNIGTKVYIIGGVGDKRYYNDVWVFDIYTCSWTQLEIRGQQPQGRFSHTAVAADMDIVIYGGCGEDERPLDELLVLQLGAEHPNGRYNVSMGKVFGSCWKKTCSSGADSNLKAVLMGNNADTVGTYEFTAGKKQPFHLESDASQQKKRRIAASKVWDVDLEQEEHSLSLSQHSSPTQSDREHNTAQKPNASTTDSQRFLMFKPLNQIPTSSQHDNPSINPKVLKNSNQRNPQGFHYLKQYHHVYDAEHSPMVRGPIQHLIGAEVRGRVDGAFDSGLLMTATVNGKIFRGVLFAPGTGTVSRRPSMEPSSWMHGACATNSNHKGENTRGCQQVSGCSRTESCQVTQPFPMMRAKGAASFSKEEKMRSDLNGLALTLGGAASGHHRGGS